MKMLKKWLLTAGYLLLTASFTAPASAQEVWKLGTAAQPGSVLYDIVLKFINDFNAVSGNELKLEYQLIGNEQEMHQQVVRGRIQAGASSFAGGSILVPEGAVFNTPFLWRNDEERAWVTDNYGLSVAKKLYAEKGLELILVADVGWNDIICKTACHYVMTRHYHHPSTFIVNKALLDGLKPELRAKLLKALPDANWARKQVADTEGPKMKEFVAKGGFVHQLTDAQREAWAAVIRPGQAEMVQAIGGKAQEVMDALNNGKKAWAEKSGKK